MPGMVTGKSLVFRVTRMRPLYLRGGEDDRVGRLHRGRSRRISAARCAISRRLRRSRTGENSSRQLASSLDLRQHLGPHHAADPMRSCRACRSRQRRLVAGSASIRILRVERAAAHEATVLPMSRPAIRVYRRCRSSSARTDREIRLSRPRNRRPTGASMTRARDAAIRPRRRCRSDPSKPKPRSSQSIASAASAR